MNQDEHNYELDEYLDELEAEWHYIFKENKSFEPIDYDKSEAYFYGGKTVEEAIANYIIFLKTTNQKEFCNFIKNKHNDN